MAGSSDAAPELSSLSAAKRGNSMGSITGLPPELLQGMTAFLPSARELAPTAQDIRQAARSAKARGEVGVFCGSDCPAWSKAKEFEPGLCFHWVGPLPQGAEAVEGTPNCARVVRPGDVLQALSLSSSEQAPRVLRAAEKVSAIQAVRRRGTALRDLSEEMRRDPDVVTEALRRDGYALSYAAPMFRATKAFVLEALKTSWFALRFADERLRADKEVGLAAVSRGGLALEYVAEALKDDQDVVLAAVRESALALQFASQRLRGDREIVTAALATAVAQRTSRVLAHASEELRRDPDLLLETLRAEGCAALYGAELRRRWNDDAFMQSAGKSGACALRDASPELQGLPAFVIGCVQHDERALGFAAPALRRSSSFGVEVAKTNPGALQDLHRRARREAEDELRKRGAERRLLRPTEVPKIGALSPIMSGAEKEGAPPKRLRPNPEAPPPEAAPKRRLRLASQSGAGMSGIEKAAAGLSSTSQTSLPGEEKEASPLKRRLRLKPEEPASCAKRQRILSTLWQSLGA